MFSKENSELTKFTIGRKYMYKNLNWHGKLQSVHFFLKPLNFRFVCQAATRYINRLVVY